MTRYEQGFMNKCAEHGLSEDQGSNLMKLAAKINVANLSRKELLRILGDIPLVYDPPKSRIIRMFGRALRNNNAKAKDLAARSLQKYSWKDTSIPNFVRDVASAKPGAPFLQEPLSIKHIFPPYRNV